MLIMKPLQFLFNHTRTALMVAIRMAQRLLLIKFIVLTLLKPAQLLQV
nr:MAG TPA: hypothetical protein [Caudoviricetes sp.]